MVFDLCKAIIAREKRLGNKFAFSDAVMAFVNARIDTELRQLSSQIEARVKRGAADSHATSESI